ncbi:DUF4349 domain-containing protein [Agathobaculum sp.]|uniref:DUF4349 domain-containing protein n=1 Tax=Agathobaculum sp. TaxID=2048138 RepID=UPI003AF17098
MKKRLLPLFLALLLSLSACGSSSGGTANSAAAGDASADNGWAEAAMDAADTAGGADFSAVRRNAKLILNADLSLETQDFEKSAADIEKMTAEAGGYIESSGTYGDTGSRSANYTLRVPQEKFEQFYAQLGENMHVVSRSRSSEDVTEQYTDIETRLATLQTKHERLLSLLEKADKMEDIIALENALADCEYEIDSLTGSKRRYDDLVGFSTFYINLREVQTLTATADGTGFGAQLTQAAKTGARGLADVVRGTILGVVMFWPAVILVIAGTAAGVILHRRRKAKRLAAWNAQMQQTPPPAPPVETPQDNPQEKKE